MKWLALLTLLGTSASATQTQEWRFNVQLDGKNIGYHRFAVDARGAERTLTSQARFDVKLFFINAYSYEHTAKEIWLGECLEQLAARTDDNGDEIVVNGQRADDRFVVVRDATRRELKPCVQTFAYWNPSILSATQLLNPQTGEYVPVTISELGVEALTVGGRTQQTTRYRIVGKPARGEVMQIDLWYSDARQWVALESVADGGRRLRYTLVSL